MSKFKYLATILSRFSSISHCYIITQVKMIEVKKYISLVLTFLFFSIIAFSQSDTNPFSYIIDTSIPYKIDGNWSEIAWAGGVNAHQYQKIDLDRDGKEDLVIFDQSTNECRPFLYVGTPSDYHYKYAPEYTNSFPKELNMKLIIRDYNCDGKPDLFSQHPNGLSVYKNISNDSNLKWELAVDYLKTRLPSGVTNALVAYSDLPVLDDIDGDGDLDLATFGLTGSSQMKLYKNETTTCDSFNLILQAGCWGGFRESNNSNLIYLNVACKGATSVANSTANVNRHAGSTATAVDLTGNGIYDLLLGDVSMNSVTALYNTGTPESTEFTGIEYDFPNGGNPINMREFIGTFNIDIDNDGKKDVMAAPFDKKECEDRQNGLYYKNISGSAVPSFELQTSDFLKDQIDLGTGSNPTFVDVDGDSLIDIVAGNTGYFVSYNDTTQTIKRVGKLGYFKNIGTKKEPAYKLITDDFLNLSTFEMEVLSPTFGDMDGDGDQDMLLGLENGAMYYYENSAALPTDSMNLTSNGSYYFGIGVNSHARPSLYDVNDDNALDLIIGDLYGVMRLFLNQGDSTNAQFLSTPTVDTLGGLHLYKPGYRSDVSAFVADFSPTHQKILCVGSMFGDIRFYDGLNTDIYGDFTLLDSVLIGNASHSINGIDIRANDSIEIVIGKLSGGMQILSLGEYSPVFNPWSDIIDTTDTTDSTISVWEHGAETIKVYPNPAQTELVIGWKEVKSGQQLQAKVYDLSGRKLLSENIISQTEMVLSISELKNGSYFLVLSDGLNKKTIQFVKIE